MVLVTAVLIVGDEDNAVLPEGTVPHGVHDLRDEGLAALNIARRVLIVFRFDPEDAEVRINERDAG